MTRRGRTGTGRHRGGHRRGAAHNDEFAGGTHHRNRFPHRLSRDPVRGRIGGVCAGIARYFGAEVWVVRCIAATGLIFMPSLVFPAYWILYFLMGSPAGKAGVAGRDNGRHDHSSPAPEFGSQLSPRRSLRNAQADLAQSELRLRRIERHVTSKRYTLQKELNTLDGDGRAR